MDSDTMTAEKSKTGVTSDEVKQKVLKTLSNIKEEDKLNYLVNRVVQLEIEAAKATSDKQKLEAQTKKISLLDKKVATLEGLVTKTEVSKAKLEELCRELSKRNKEINETNANKIKLIEESHRATVKHLQESLGDIQETVNAKREQTQRVADVEKLSAGLKDLSVEYEKRLGDLKTLYEEREVSLETISKNKDEEINILKSEMSNMHTRVQQVFGENVTLKKHLIENDTKLKTALESEIEMRKLLNNYTEKYQNLLNTLARSNESFDKVKKEMTKMNGNLIKVEGDARKWKQRVEEANSEVSKLAANKVENEKALALKERQLAQLQELCRRLKAEQTSTDTKSEESS